MIDVGPNSSAVAGAVLLGVLVIGILAGRAKQRLTLLLFGLLAMVGVVIALNALVRQQGGDRAAEFTGLYLLGLPLVAVYLAGWLCARGSWFTRVLVVVLAVALVLVFPYAQAGQATAALVGGG
ncbi:hypothetical protein [Pseudonocardia humida]|uniref:Uncharacterized protein n=1 Tax=Pseudonocardia humida TaxID=2800819 RepID=A0ABT1A0V0_9PSEU|nr:hypothetical protein [Pseudonocardia humida]MCO1656626.1 hypothetical protein [Pseudonocardia humida]